MTRPVNTILAISIIVVLAAIIGGVIWWQCQQPTGQVSPTSGQTGQEQNIQRPANQPASEIDPYAGWKTYTNEEYGFSFMYPGDWYAFGNNDLYEKMCQAEFKAEGPNDFLNNDCVSKNMIVEISNVNGYCTKGGCIGTDFKKIENLGFSNLKGFTIDKTSLANMTNYKNILLDSKRYAVVEKKEIVKDNVTLSYFYVEGNDGGWSWQIFWTKNSNNFWMRSGAEGERENMAKKQVLDQILSTFKFIDMQSTADWKTYANDDAGYSIKYPDSWKILGPIEESSAKDVLFGPNPEMEGAMPDPTIKTYIQIAKPPLYGKTPEGAIISFENTRRDYSKKEQIEFSGQSAYRFSGSNWKGEGNIILIPYKGQLWQIWFQQNEQDVQKSLSTFKFTK